MQALGAPAQRSLNHKSTGGSHAKPDHQSLLRRLDACSLRYFTLAAGTNESKCGILIRSQGTRALHMSPGVSLACRLMPELAIRIRVLAMEDRSFVDLCDDLAVAQRALEGMALVPEALRQNRLTECESWIVDLCDEVRTAVSRRSASGPPRI